ncbi:hypothetical protein C942_01919 [Photobacterium marinum]|uniref:Uncharacterized protein n=1 Tax=Photobacterium marinum TaxID=1056511 RepID=L8JBB4_9GAMM|nr:MULTISPECIES: hypothetical protein [Photobacterium]ELR64829.1 hypothetical protein C942_01919 [Photobacterium marinum]
MLKLAVILVLLMLGILATKYLDEKSQQKLLVGLGIIVGCAVAFLMATELMR